MWGFGTGDPIAYVQPALPAGDPTHSTFAPASKPLALAKACCEQKPACWAVFFKGRCGVVFAGLELQNVGAASR